MSISKQLELQDFEESLDERIARLEHAHRDESILREKYINEGLSTREVASELSCSQSAVLRWLRRHEIKTRDQKSRLERASRSITPEGYEIWSVGDPDGTTSVCVHQLAAISGGADPHEVFSDKNHCHHSTAHPAANVPRLIEVMSDSEHRFLHHNGEWQYDDEGFPVLTLPDGDD